MIAADDNKIIQGLWIGPTLSQMEQLSIASFLANGHDYHLFVYDDVKNIPVGTTLKDANEILPAAAIFQYAGRPSYAGFANFFRYKLLLERGGWWADTDTVCLRPFDFDERYVFSSELSKGFQVVNCGVVWNIPFALINCGFLRKSWRVATPATTPASAEGISGSLALAQCDLPLTTYL